MSRIWEQTIVVGHQALVRVFRVHVPFLEPKNES